MIKLGNLYRGGGLGGVGDKERSGRGQREEGEEVCYYKYSLVSLNNGDDFTTRYSSITNLNTLYL